MEKSCHFSKWKLGLIVTTWEQCVQYFFIYASKSSVILKYCVTSYYLQSITSVFFLKHVIFINIPAGSAITSPWLNQDSQNVQKCTSMTTNIPYYTVWSQRPFSANPYPYEWLKAIRHYSKNWQAEVLYCQMTMIITV